MPLCAAANVLRFECDCAARLSCRRPLVFAFYCCWIVQAKESEETNKQLSQLVDGQSERCRLDSFVLNCNSQNVAKKAVVGEEGLEVFSGAAGSSLTGSKLVQVLPVTRPLDFDGLCFVSIGRLKYHKCRCLKGHYINIQYILHTVFYLSTILWFSTF